MLLKIAQVQNTRHSHGQNVDKPKPFTKQIRQWVPCSTFALRAYQIRKVTKITRQSNPGITLKHK